MCKCKPTFTVLSYPLPLWEISELFINTKNKKGHSSRMLPWLNRLHSSSLIIPAAHCIPSSPCIRALQINRKRRDSWEGNQEVSNSWQLHLERNNSGWTLTEQQITFPALYSAVQSSLPLPLQSIHMYKNHDTCSKQYKNRETWTKQCDLGAGVSEGC